MGFMTAAWRVMTAVWSFMTAVASFVTAVLSFATAPLRLMSALVSLGTAFPWRTAVRMSEKASPVRDMDAPPSETRLALGLAPA